MMEKETSKRRNAKVNTTFTVTTGDFNNDGFLDMVTGNALFYNQNIENILNKEML